MGSAFVVGVTLADGSAWADTSIQRSRGAETNSIPSVDVGAVTEACALRRRRAP